MGSKQPTLDQLADRFHLFFDDFDTSQLYFSYNLASFLLKEHGVLRVLDRKKFTTLVYKFFVKQKRTDDDPLPYNFNPSPSVIRDFIAILPGTFVESNIIDEYKLHHVALKDNTFLNTNSFEIEPYSDKTIAFLRLPITSKDFKSQKDPLKHAPLFSGFLTSSLVTASKPQATDLDLISLIQEMFGYLLIPSNKAHGAFFLYGDGANGKSVVLEVVDACFPEDLVTRKSLERLTSNRFATSALLGKLINIAGEDDSRYLATDVFKQLVTGEAIDAEFKHGDSFSFRPHVKLLFSVNELPSFGSLGYSIRRRLHILPFNRRFLPHERNVDLAEQIITQELTHVILWALQGAKRLKEQNFAFSRSEQALDTIKQMELTQSSPLEFIYDNYDITKTREDDDYQSRAHLYRLYRYWCDENGRKARPKTLFFSEILKRYDDLESIRRREFPTANPTHMIAGLRQKTDEDTWVKNYGNTLDTRIS